MIIIGVTGSIAMGKSTVTAMFAAEGIATTNADQIVHDLLAQDAEVIAEVQAQFPKAVENGVINRQKLGEAVFGDSDAVQKLESILHPRVRLAEVNFVLKQQSAGAEMVVLDIPLLFESGADARVDKVVVVTAPPSVQRERVMARPHMTEEKFQHILARQLPDGEKRKRADYVIETDKGLERTRLRVLDIIDELKG